MALNRPDVTNKDEETRALNFKLERLNAPFEILHAISRLLVQFEKFLTRDHTVGRVGLAIEAAGL